LKVKTLEEAIKYILLKEGQSTARKLCREVMSIFPCSEKGFYTHLLNMVKTKEINKKEEGQYKVYFLPTKRKPVVEQTSYILDDMIKDSKKEFQKYLKSLDKFTDSGYSKKSAQKKFEIFDLGHTLIQIILNQSQLTTFLIHTQYPSIAMKKKAKAIQKINEEQLKEIFSTLKKIDSSLQSMVLRGLFAELFK